MTQVFVDSGYLIALELFSAAQRQKIFTHGLHFLRADE